MFFTKKIKISLREFITELKSGNKDVLNILGLKERSFDDVPYSLILENPMDIAAGVISVKTMNNIKAFDMFDEMLIKGMDDDDTKYIFYTFTSNSKKVNEIYTTIYNLLGEGYYDSEIQSSFDDKEKIERISQGIYSSEKDNLLSVWLLDDITVSLKYNNQPSKEFSLFVTKSVPKAKDLEIRNNGTILELLKNDFRAIFIEDENFNIPNVEDDGTISFITYHYSLEEKEFGCFDKLQIQQGGDKKDHTLNKGINLTFTSSQDIPLMEMSEIIERLIKMYGPDHIGTNELEIHELDILERNSYWAGRSWSFNQSHGSHDIDNDDEEMTYSVWISYNDLEEGFTLTILGFNSLIHNFGSN